MSASFRGVAAARAPTVVPEVPCERSYQSIPAKLDVGRSLAPLSIEDDGGRSHRDAHLGARHHSEGFIDERPATVNPYVDADRLSSTGPPAPATAFPPRTKLPQFPPMEPVSMPPEIPAKTPLPEGVQRSTCRPAVR